MQSRLNAFKLDQRGLARVLGELEAEIMDAVWSHGPVTVAGVCEVLGDGAHYKTVMTVMNRLVDKGLLTRRRVKRAFAYSAPEDRDAFTERVSRTVAVGLVEDFGAVAVAQFLDAVDAVDPELLARLGRMVRERTDAAVEANASGRDGSADGGTDGRGDTEGGAGPDPDERAETVGGTAQDEDVPGYTAPAVDCGAEPRGAAAGGAGATTEDDGGREWSLDDA